MVRPLLLLGAMLFFIHPSYGQTKSKIAWEAWSDSVFERAKSERRFVLLDLGTGWCHWCHVMEEVTYEDPQVVDLIKKQYIPIRVDADSRPDLSSRYQDYGWPATIVFGGDGGEIVKRQGYIPPLPMASMLRAIIDDPSPGPSIVLVAEVIPASSAVLITETREELRARLLATYDPKERGWGTEQKFLDWDIVEYCLDQAIAGDKKFEQMGRETLNAQMQLIDPVWGGVYQYSTDGDWKHPHFEKIMQMQAEDLRIYALAYAQWHDPQYLDSARKIRAFLKLFLTSPEGAFYVSQDADLIPGEHSGEYFKLTDEARRKQGVPRVDQHRYSRENGWAVTGLAALYAASHDQSCLDDAIRAANWIIAERSVAGGGFRHDKSDASGPYLGDTLAMGRAFLSLYEVTGDRIWLDRAEKAAQFIVSHFQDNSGFLTTMKAGSFKARPQVDENVSVVRFANQLNRYTGKTEFRAMAELAMEFLGASGVTNGRGFQVGGFLLADHEISTPPVHITVVGRKDDDAARSLFLGALKAAPPYHRIEWWDSSEGSLPNADVEYPELDRAAAFFCNDNSCSPPFFSAENLARKVQPSGTR